MRRTHAHRREQDNHRFFVPHRIAVRNHLQPAGLNANITFCFVNHNGTVLGLPAYAYVPGLATGTEVTLMALDPNKPTVVMACSESHNWFTALAQRWHVPVVTITLEEDLLSQCGENLAKHAVAKTRDVLFFAGPCTGGSSWARLNITRGPTTSKLIQNKQLEFWKLFKVFSQLKRRAESKKAATPFELPKSCECWNDERLKKQIKLGEPHEFDGCRYGLKQRYAKKPLSIRKPWRVISRNFDLGESLLSKKCNGNHSHGPCAGRETKDTQLYTSLIVNVILRRFAARANCSRHHGVNLASPCIFNHFAEKKKRLQGERSSTSTSPSTLPVEGWWSCTPLDQGTLFLCLRLCWIAELYIFKMGDDSINSEEYLFVSPSKARRRAFYCASLVEKYVAGLRAGRPLPRIDEDCSEVVASRWIAEAGVPALHATSAYYKSPEGHRILSVAVQRVREGHDEVE